MLNRTPDNPVPMRRGKAFLATLIGCCALVAFAMLKQVELTNDQAIAIAVLCGACVLTALVGEYAAERGRINAFRRARDKKLARANAAAKKAMDAAAAAANAPPPGTSFGSSAKEASPAPSPTPAPAVAETTGQSASPLEFASLGKKPSGNQRKFGRLPLEQLTCNLGEVHDLSAGGMKVLSPENGSGCVEIVLNDGDETVTISGAIVWSKRHDSRHWELGVEFDDLTPEDRRQLTHLATAFRQRRTMCA